MEDDRQQDIGSAETGNDEAHECCDSPEEHLDVTVFLVRHCERFPETDDRRNERDQREGTECHEKENSLVLP